MVHTMVYVPIRGADGSDSILDRLTTVLGRVSGTSATGEPRVLQPQDGADQRRGGIKVSKHGNTWILDVGVVCPVTQRYVDQGSGTTPGLAAGHRGASGAEPADRR